MRQGEPMDPAAAAKTVLEVHLPPDGMPLVVHVPALSRITVERPGFDYLILTIEPDCAPSGPRLLTVSDEDLGDADPSVAWSIR